MAKVTTELKYGVAKPIAQLDHLDLLKSASIVDENIAEEEDETAPNTKTNKRPVKLEKKSKANTLIDADPKAISPASQQQTSPENSPQPLANPWATAAAPTAAELQRAEDMQPGGELAADQDPVEE